MAKLSGHCLCGAISYSIADESALGKIYNCHCSKCRCWGGDAFRTSTTVKAEAFKWIKGEDKLNEYHYNKDVIKTFCSLCGTNLISLYPNNREVFGISLGGLEGSLTAKPIAHIFVGSKASWYDIEDHLPQYQEHAPLQD